MMITFRLNNLVSPEKQKSSTKGHISTPAEGWNVYLVHAHIKSWMPLSIRDTVTHQQDTGHIRPQVTWPPSLNHSLLKAWLPTLDLENTTTGWQSRELDSCSYRSIFRFLTFMRLENYRWVDEFCLFCSDGNFCDSKIQILLLLL